MFPALLPPPSTFVTVQQILLTSFLEDASAAHGFEIGQRCCLAERSEAVIRVGVMAHVIGQRRQRVSHVWGVTHWLARSNVHEPGCSGGRRQRGVGTPNILHVKSAGEQRSVIRENTILSLCFFLFASIG